MLFDDEDLDFLKGDEVKKAAKIAEPPKEIVYGPYSEEGLIKMVKKIPLDPEAYKKFTPEHFQHSLNFYDFEIFMYDWMVTILNPLELTKTVIVNDRQALIEYHRTHEDQFWVGYNSKHYDVSILKGIVLGLNPKKVSDDIVVRDIPGWRISDDFKKVKLLNFDIKTTDESLKQLEAFMGDDIRETSVPFDIDRKLTRPEILESVKYNMHDVDETVKVFERRIFEYDAYMELMETFDLPIGCISQTKAQMTATILECEPVKGRSEDEFDLQIVPVLQIKKYRDVVDWFRNPSNMSYKKGVSTVALDNDSKKSPYLVCGIPHTFGWGGLHGCKAEPIIMEGNIWHVDVTSYYPSMMIVYNFLTRNCKRPEKFKIIYDTRVALKKAGKKKEQAPYKIVLNGTFGISKDRYNPAYDPRQANNICVNGQLMLLDLLEHLEPYVEILQSNTDGLIIRIPEVPGAQEKFEEVCKEWEQRTGMGLGRDAIRKIAQKDVNNYVFMFANGKLERKGAFTQECDELKNDLPIVSEAVVQYLMYGKPVEQTINECNDLVQFQKIVRVKGAFKYGWHNGKYMNEKTYRVFASTDRNDSQIARVRDKGESLNKFGNTPDHCFIDNTKVKGKIVPEKLDRQWYIDATKDRLEAFGIEFEERKQVAGGLF